jgi:hypothetical protein
LQGTKDFKESVTIFMVRPELSAKLLYQTFNKAGDLISSASQHGGFANS